MHPCNIKTDSTFVLEDSLSSLGEDGVFYLALRNQIANERVRRKEQTVVGKPVLTNFLLNAELVNKVEEELKLDDTTSEISSFSQNFLSSTEMSKVGLSETEKLKRTDALLLKPTPGPDLSSVLFWGKEATEKLSSIINEYENLFMKNKPDIGRCQIAKYRIELEPIAIPHREEAGECPLIKRRKLIRGYKAW